MQDTKHPQTEPNAGEETNLTADGVRAYKSSANARCHPG